MSDLDGADLYGNAVQENVAPPTAEASLAYYCAVVRTSGLLEVYLNVIRS